MRKETLINKLKKELNITKVSLTSGLSNDNYLLDDKFHLKITYDNHFPLCTDFVLLDAAEQSGLGLKIIKEHASPFYQLSYYQKDLKSLCENELTNVRLDKIIAGIKLFHALPWQNLVDRSIADMCRQFLLCTKNPSLGFLDIFAPLPLVPKTPVHFDLVLDNILFDKNDNVKIIDYDLSGLSYPYLDIVSLLSENNFSPEQTQYIIAHYFETDAEREAFSENLPIFQYYFDLLWSVWAKVRKAKASAKKRKVYEEIWKVKFNRANSFASTEI